VDVLASTDLHLLYKPNTKEIKTRYLNKLAWSFNGQTLYAGGGHLGSDQCPIRRWTDEGRGSYRDILVGAEATITGLKSLPNERLAFGTTDAKCGVLAADGAREMVLKAGFADFRSPGQDLRVDSSGRRVRFSYKVKGQPAAIFSVPDRILTNAQGEEAVFTAARTEAPNLDITNWHDAYNTSVNGKLLNLDKNEASSNLAITPDGQFFALGTVFYIRFFDRVGRERWKTNSPSIVRAVNISADRRLVVVAFGDGTIHWFRADNGRELLAFCPHSDGKRWVVWTPSGYYDASVGGEDLIGWHVNRGPDQAADFFPASRFRDRFYRPDVVSRILDTLDETAALAQADGEARPQADNALTKILPPVVTILAPDAETEVRETSVPFHVTVRSPSGEPVTAVRAFVDGRPAGSTRGLVYAPDPKPADPSAEREYTFIVLVPSHNCTVEIIAETRLSSSDPVPAKLHWVAAPPPIEKPTLYLLAVGVGTYSNPAFNLDLPAKDARDVAASWRAQKGGLYQNVEVKLLTDEKATKDAILDGLEWLERQTTEKDVALLYFSGHGLNDPRSGEYLFLPYEANLEFRRKTLLPDREVRSALSAIPGKVLVFLDSCHSGDLLGAAKSRDATDMTRLLNELTSAESGVVVFAASTGRQQAIESQEWKNGAFTHALLEALSGKANYRDNSLYVTELESYLDRRVKELTKGLQTPVVRRPDAISDFPVAVIVVPK
jgi:hypothetical protein